MRKTIFAALLALSGCVMPLKEIRSHPAVDDLVSSRSADAIRQCLITEFSRDGFTPVINGEELWFNSMEGPVFHYILSPVPEGTHVQTRRHDRMLGGLGKGRACYKP